MKNLLGIFVLPLIANMVSCNSIAVKTYTLESDKIAENSAIKIILIADLHSTIFGEKQKSLIEKITEQKPDVIVWVGDIVDDVVPILGTQLLLSGIHSIAPIYYVTGNHEYWSRNIQSIRSGFIRQNSKIVTVTGWKTSRIGIFPANCIGDIVFPPTICLRADLSLPKQKKRLCNWPMTGCERKMMRPCGSTIYDRMKTRWIHGFRAGYGLFPFSTASMSRTTRKSIIITRPTIW